MKVGSLVVCIDNSRYADIIPELEPTIYTVREINMCSCGFCGRLIIKLEEIINEKNHRGIEFGYLARDFKEVLPADVIKLDDIFQEGVPA